MILLAHGRGGGLRPAARCVGSQREGRPGQLAPRARRVSLVARRQLPARRRASAVAQLLVRLSGHEQRARIRARLLQRPQPAREAGAAERSAYVRQPQPLRVRGHEPVLHCVDQLLLRHVGGHARWQALRGNGADRDAVTQQRKEGLDPRAIARRRWGRPAQDAPQQLDAAHDAGERVVDGGIALDQLVRQGAQGVAVGGERCHGGLNHARQRRPRVQPGPQLQEATQVVPGVGVRDTGQLRVVRRARPRPGRRGSCRRRWRARRLARTTCNCGECRPAGAGEVATARNQTGDRRQRAAEARDEEPGRVGARPAARRRPAHDGCRAVRRHHFHEPLRRQRR